MFNYSWESWFLISELRTSCVLNCITTGNQLTTVCIWLPFWLQRGAWLCIDIVRCGAVCLAGLFWSLLPSCGSSLAATRCEIRKALLQLRNNWGLHALSMSLQLTTETILTLFTWLFWLSLFSDECCFWFYCMCSISVVSSWLILQFSQWWSSLLHIEKQEKGACVSCIQQRATVACCFYPKEPPQETKCQHNENTPLSTGDYNVGKQAFYFRISRHYRLFRRRRIS